MGYGLKAKARAVLDEVDVLGRQPHDTTVLHILERLPVRLDSHADDWVRCNPGALLLGKVSCWDRANGNQASKTTGQSATLQFMALSTRA